MALALVKPWSTQPYRTVGVNWSNGLSRGLQSYGTIINGAPYDVVNGVGFSRIGAASRTAKAEGMYASVGNGSTDVWTCNIGTRRFSAIATASIFVIAYTTVADTTRKRALRFANATNGTILNFDFSDGSQTEIQSGAQVTGATFPRVGSNTAYTANLVYSLVFTRSGTNMNLYISGKQIGTSFFESSNNFAGDINQVFICNSGSGFPLQGGVLAWGLWDRVLTQQEAAQISFNPWQLFTGIEVLGLPTPYPILSNLQATRGNTSASLRTNITY